MSKLDQLIKELCPDGVEYKYLYEVTNWDKKFNGTDKNMQKVILNFKHISSKKLKELHNDKGTITLLSTGDFSGFGKYDECKEYINNGEIITIPSGGRAIIKYYNGDFVDSGNLLASSSNNYLYNLKYVWYYLNNNIKKIENLFRGSSIQHPDMPSILNLKLAIPPLVIQNEIVSILDNFTELTAELTAELTEELTARKKQYEYYRDSLIYQDKFKKVRLDEIGTFVRGKRFIRTDIVTQGVNCMHYGDIYTKYGLSTKTTDTYLTEEKSTKMRLAYKNDIIIVQAGENEYDLGVGVVWESDEKLAVHDACYIYTTDQNSRYISYYLRTHKYHQDLIKYVSSGKISSVNSIGIGKSEIPLPPLSEQQRIVDILDKFDTLVNDISQGLPAEIDARKKQYEYYRDKLLTFPEKK